MSYYVSLTWLLAIIVVIDTVGLIALIRQVGLLHLRLRPVPALSDAEGPPAGASLDLLRPIPTLLGDSDPVALIVWCFVSPSCGLCAPLIPGLLSLRAHMGAGERLAFVLDADQSRASEYLRSRHAERVPFTAHPTLFSRNRVPGAPFAVVTDSAGIVLTSGGVNTLEQVESLLATAGTLGAGDGSGGLLPSAAPTAPVEVTNA